MLVPWMRVEVVLMKHGGPGATCLVSVDHAEQWFPNVWTMRKDSLLHRTRRIVFVCAFKYGGLHLPLNNQHLRAIF